MYKSVKLVDLCTIKTGKKDVNEGNLNGKFPFFTCAKEHTYSDEFSFDCEAILIAGNGAVGQTTHFKGKFEAYQRTYVLTDFKNVLPKLLFIILQEKLMKYLSSMVLGNTMPYIKKGMLEDFKFVLPSLKNQQVLLDKLNSNFTEIENIITKIQKKKENLYKFNQSILDRKFDINCKLKNLGDVCNFIGGGTPSKNNNSYYNGNIPWATVRDMTVDEISNTQHKITDGGLKNSSAKIVPGENVVIASRVGLGKVCIVKQNTAINQDLRGVIPKKKEVIDVHYLFYWFKKISKNIINAGRGATVHGVTLPFLKSLEIPLPEIEEQKVVVTKLNSAFIEINKLNQIIIKQIENYKALKYSILEKKLQQLL